MNNSKMRTAAVAAGIVSVAAVGLASMGAGNAVAGTLPGGFITQTLVDGTKVTVQLKNEFFRLQPSTVALPTSRNVVVSGQVIATVGGSGAKGGTIAAGYVVGCQVNIGGSANGTASFGGGLTPNGLTPITRDPSGSANGGGAAVALGPGQAVYVPIIQDTDDSVDTTNDNYNINDFSFSGNRGGIAYSQEQFSVDGCAGFAQAKARVTVSVSTDSVDGVVTLNGRPFSLG